MVEELRETERRVLGNLPVWRTEEDHEQCIEWALEEGTIPDADSWPRASTVAVVAQRVVADQYCVIVPQTRVVFTDEDGEETHVNPETGNQELTDHPEDVVTKILEDLKGRGLVETEGNTWKMTQAGLAALEA